MRLERTGRGSDPAALTAASPTAVGRLSPTVDAPPERHERPAERRTEPASGVRVAALYPALLAVFPTLHVVTRTVGTYSMGDLALIVAVVLGLTLAVLALGAAVARALGRDAPLARGALLTAVAVAWTFYFIPFQNALAPIAGPLARSAVLGPMWLIGSVAPLWLAVRRRRWTLDGVAHVLFLAGVLLVVSAAMRVARANVGSRARVERSAIWRALQTPVRTDPARTAVGPKRDIYLIVLDGYPNAAVLRTKFGYDNSRFVDSLRALGFTIPKHVRSNYVSTLLSLSSVLNFEHDTLLARDVPPNSVDNTIVTALTRENRVARFLKERGYRFLLFPTEWVEFTRDSPLADYVYPGPPRIDVRAEFQRSELRRVMFESTLLSKFRALHGGYGGRFVLDEFRRLRDVPGDSAPTFTFAHFMLPHQPIVLDSACRPVNPGGVVIGERMGMPGPRAGFLGVLQCSNAQVLALVEALFRRSPVAPIVIVIGDHGTLSRGWAVDAKLPTDSIAAERLGAFAAFYMPDGGAAMFEDSTTHVNIFRNVLRHYFGADLPPASNEGFFNQAGEAYRFRPVNESVVLGG
ncbi:hypothetical protein J421_2512 [Gemmatirosa kalamazoonensis]|uniref:Sulfatase n=1 Tax=Gemmatirosa kalamazoonensis TaxID=861299 RepID=W0RG10_9BACT|nr:hypothetical protein [Gemmatirosa kalamazoonensis]AHG90049.1 hypothetical protein J421_2512 [Gemmatirosa kalamazoonensis]